MSMFKVIKAVQIFVLLVTSVVIISCDAEVKDNGMGEFLPVEKAFVLSVSSTDKDSISARWDIADGYHLYKDKFEFALVNDDYQIVSLDMPKGKMIEDKIFGNKESYDRSMEVKILLKPVNDSGKVIVKTSYQGCSEKGLCYPPQSVETELMLKGS